jgi:hypothetical protein
MIWSFLRHLTKRLTRLSGFSAIGYVGGDLGQLRALADHNTADERREGAQVPGNIADGLAGRVLCRSLTYGTISAEVVTHRLLLLVWLL